MPGCGGVICSLRRADVSHSEVKTWYYLFCMGLDLPHALQVQKELRLVHRSQDRRQEMTPEPRRVRADPYLHEEKMLDHGKLARAASCGTYHFLSKVTCTWPPILVKPFLGRCSPERHSRRPQPLRNILVVSLSIHHTCTNLCALNEVRHHQEIWRLWQAK